MRSFIFGLFVLVLSAAAASAADAKVGQPLYDKACKTCHGVNGAPNPKIEKINRVTMRDLRDPGVVALTDEEWKKWILNGGGKMKPAKDLSAAQADDLLAYCRTFKK